MTDTLSVIIPARNEQFLKNTIEDILQNMRGDTEVIAVLDGHWANPPVRDDPRVRLIYHSQSIGQRAACNEAAKLSQAKYIMKCDAHCAFDEGFDVKLMADMQDDWTVVPIMRNLHVFNLVCPEGHTRYQGPSGPCKECGKPTKMDIVWIAKTNPQSTSYCFDSEPHFQYFNEYKKRPEAKGDFTETMSLQGSCWMMTREKYFELGVCDEAWGSWGSQGIEVAVKTWLSGGRVICNHKTFYGHAFRTQGGDWGFPYPISGNQVEHAKKMARETFFENKWPKQIYPLSWLIEKFWPVRGWSDEDLARIKKTNSTFKPAKPQVGGVVSKPVVIEPNVSSLKGIVWYTDNRLPPSLMEACQRQLQKAVNNHKIISVSLQPVEFGDNIVLSLERGYLTMFREILAGLKANDAEIIYFAEHDVLYHKSHFDFIPPDRTKIYYNQNVWHVRVDDGHAVYYEAKRTSQLCAYRDVLIEHYQKRVQRTQEMFETLDKMEFGRFIRKQGFEPGSHHRAERVDDLQSDIWRSEYPNIDLKHGQNLTPARWRQDQFRDQRNCRGWIEADDVPGWGVTKGRMAEILEKAKEA